MTRLVAKWKWRRIPLSAHPGAIEQNAVNSRRQNTLPLGQNSLIDTYPWRDYAACEVRYY